MHLTLDWMQVEATRRGFALCGSCVWNLNNSLVNRCFFVTPEGEVHTYDKVHLFRMGGEHHRYSPGQDRVVVKCRGWRFLLAICYDLRFPVFCRNKQDYDALICVANWPASRIHAWTRLLEARAIENQTYVIGVNRVGEDGKGWRYSGQSQVWDPAARPQIEFDAYEPGWRVTELDLAMLRKAREDFPVWQDQDDFTLLLKH